MRLFGIFYIPYIYSLLLKLGVLGENCGMDCYFMPGNHGVVKNNPWCCIWIGKRSRHFWK
jgi:hypothetical protein